MAVEEGKKAPAFTLTDESGEKVRLSELAGNWVVLYFYPRDDTPGCTVEACDFTSGLKSFEQLGAKDFDAAVVALFAPGKKRQHLVFGGPSSPTSA